MQEVIKYFKSKKGLDRFVQALYEKYRSYGKISGQVKIKNLTKEEADEINRLFLAEYKENDMAVLSIKKFNDKMNRSKFAPFDINGFVKEYFMIDLVTKKEDNDYKYLKEMSFYQDILRSMTGVAKSWFSNILEKDNDVYFLLRKKYLKDYVELKKELLIINEMLNNIPKKPEPLAIFAARFTQNPHYLDFDSTYCTLFLHALAYIDGATFPVNREKKIELLAHKNIMIDYYSNFVFTYNLLADKTWINEANKAGEVITLNMYNIINAAKIYSKSNKVFIIENPSLLNNIINRCGEVTVIVSNGFINTCLYLLLDKLIDSGVMLYYNGDFDPEGLIIADGLKQRYGDNIKLFCYELADYEISKSNNVLGDSRIKKLSKIKSDELLAIKDRVCSEKVAGYQENIQDRIIDFIVKELTN